MALIVSTLLVLSSFLLILSAAYADREIVKPSLFSPAMFTTLLFVLSYVWRPLLHIIDPYQYSLYPEALSNFDGEVIVILIVCCIFGILSFHVGFRSKLAISLSRAVPDLKWRRPIINLLILLAILGLTGSALLSILSALKSLTAFDMAFRYSLMSNFKGQGPSLFLLFNMGTFSCICAILLLSLKERKSLAGTAYLILCVTFFLGGAFFTVLSASRAPLISIVLLPFLITHYFIRPISTIVQASTMGILFLAGGVIGLLMLNPAAAATGAQPDFSATNLIARLSSTLDQFEFLYIACTQSKTYLFGLSYLQDLFLTYAPRAIFPGKPEIYGTVMLQNMLIPARFETVSLSATYPVGFFAEAFINFGPAGFIIAPFVYGVFLRALAEKALTPGPYAVALIMLLSGTISVLRSLGGQLAGVAFLLFMLLLFAAPKFSRSLLARGKVGETSYRA